MEFPFKEMEYLGVLRGRACVVANAGGLAYSWMQQFGNLKFIRRPAFARPENKGCDAMRLKWLVGWLGLTFIIPAALAAPQSVAESARNVPVAARADVVVVGGGSAAVAAAAEAARSGAKVFLMAPRNYLGEDLAGAMRLWLEPGETPDSPLARKLFAPEGLVGVSDEFDSLKFTYKADQLADPKHADDRKPPRLSDRRAESPVGDSVQYNSDVTLTADLGQVQPVKAARLTLFQRSGDFQAGSVAVEASADGKAWQHVATLRCAAKPEILTVSAPLGKAVRQVRFTVKRAPRSKRVLIGEITLAPMTKPTPTPAPASGLKGPYRPLHIKQTLDQALAAAGVQYLYGCYPTDVLRDAKGELCGVVMANRAGRQAVIAKTIIDASEHAVVARLAGARFSAAAGPQAATWITIAEKAREGAGLSVRKLDLPVAVYDDKGLVRIDKPAAWFEYTLKLDAAGEGWGARAALEQRVRDLCYDPTQLYSADFPFLIPGGAIKGVKSSSGAWPGAGKLDLGVFRAEGIGKLWVLSGWADVSREQAAQLMRPLAFITAGTRVGRAAAAGVKPLPEPQGARVARAAGEAGAAASGEVKEPLAGLRPLPASATIAQPAAALPVLGSYDVVVIGGGTAGAPAGIGAARRGAKTLVVEYLSGLGGVGTLGMIGVYCQGNRVGFTTTMPEFPLEPRMEWYRSELRKAGAEIWFESMGCGALMEGNRVTGVVVATPMGRGVVLAKNVVDATGNADIAITAGAGYVFVEDDFALQNAHVPRREVGAWYINADRPAILDTDPIQVSQAMSDRKGKAFDWGQLIDSRERRRIVGDYTVDWLDVYNTRTFPDSIMLARSNYDSHGYMIHPYFMLRAHDFHAESRIRYSGYVPYRALLPRGVEGILAAGLGMSAHRDAMPILRMQPDLQNQGYAAGVAAAMAAKAGVTPRQIDVKALQQHLVEVGNLAPSVLTDKDSYPMPKEKIAAAVTSLTQDLTALGVLLAQPQDALPLMRQAYAQSEGKAKVVYAEALGVMGDGAGLETLKKEVDRLMKVKDESGVLPAGEGLEVDPTTRVAWALGGIRDRSVVPLLCTLAGEIEPRNLPQCRSVVVSLGRIGEPAAAPTLKRLLDTWSRQGEREMGVRELIAAVALYRCGDPDGTARRVLQEFVTQPNGPWAELAIQTLQSPLGQAGK